MVITVRSPIGLVVNVKNEQHAVSHAARSLAVASDSSGRVTTARVREERVTVSVAVAKSSANSETRSGRSTAGQCACFGSLLEVPGSRSCTNGKPVPEYGMQPPRRPRRLGRDEGSR